METKRGGKRLGAGRKPVADKKKLIALYVRGEIILRFGSDDKIKDWIYDALEKYKPNTEENHPSQNTNPNHNEVGHEEPKKENYFDTNPKPINIPPSKLQSYIAEINDCNDYDSIKKVMIAVKSDRDLKPMDKITLNTMVTTIMEEKGIVEY